jgi:hypothetical protein
MRFIPTIVYGVKDYIAVALLVGAPWIFGFTQGGAETWVLVGVGIAGLLHTLITRFELGLFKLISMTKHIAMDFMAGLFLLVSPFIFGFSEQVWIPHAAFGVLEILFAAFALHGPQERTDAAATDVIHQQRVK